MRSLLDSLTDDFHGEIAQKQSFLDEAHAKLKDKTRELTDIRRKLHLLKEQTSLFEELQKKCKNLESAIQAEEARCSSGQETTTNGTLNGEAVGTFDPDEPMMMAKKRSADVEVDGVTSAAVLRAWIAAYKKNNAGLHAHVDSLLYVNNVTEDKVRLVVSKCAGVPLENLDMMLEALLQAVDSDGTQLDQDELLAFLSRVPRVQ